ncbi:hypothetical protein O6H91_19G072300 [Diphasiastrum complanatum]|uniref:Uncharacterized protein n=1 Tax=Diphasiastrum complanatum TaxID=34168 RepID=A0ACC2AWH4_DIPCM|nr:hypothetical protein O6H91_19G072300 [Diphasiastrum complanatum]
MAIARFFLSCSCSTLLFFAPIGCLSFSSQSLATLSFSRRPNPSVSRLGCYCHRYYLRAITGNAVEPDSLTQSNSDKNSCDGRPALVVDPDRKVDQKCGPNYLSLSDEELLAQCKMDTFRASGPGGQHRNKTDSAVRLRHTPTGLVSQAADDRSQHRNRLSALKRLRQVIALKVRCPIELEGYHPPPELVRILPLAKGHRHNVQQIGPQHQDFPKGAQHLMDLLWEVGGSVSDAARVLGG